MRKMYFLSLRSTTALSLKVTNAKKCVGGGEIIKRAKLVSTEVGGGDLESEVGFHRRSQRFRKATLLENLNIREESNAGKKTAVSRMNSAPSLQGGKQ